MKLLKKKIIFYDNNLLANPFIENILDELIELKLNVKYLIWNLKVVLMEEFLRKKPELAKKLKDAGFKNPKIAWDGPYKSWEKIKNKLIF